ncbi:RNA-directed DNA polymerase from retron ec67 [Streptococcus agalactiae]|uniref:RNA-directed DNA polymerase n=1 Tax=Streptococcus agalactiae TaxID=1311 RepID=A0AB38VLD3_STRAG|nr:retron Ec67 family RNA-directed DNA polymerase/endonuclease [Streptococcus agalactiae]SUN09021.1 RNA-directed DNA polymerase from retron ec67 [Streptococcus agalactiae]VED64371.1 RNA-directed DNA polymerase from retron ec67 [Streptococcus agalactiae]
MGKLQELETKDEFARLLGFNDARYINYLLYHNENNQDKKFINTENLYYSFTIPKKSGGVREINAPKDELKFVQRKLAEILWDDYVEMLKVNSKNKDFKIPSISHGFEKEKSIITNAKQHRNKRFVLNLDLDNFFDSFNFGRVRGFFIKDKDFGTTPEIATVIAQITCYQGKLPQGAPSSPIITNLIARILDYRIVKIAKKYRFTYTRYADDLTFSTNRELYSNKLKSRKELENFLEEIKIKVEASGFSINEKKTRLSDQSQRQEVTGIVVNKKLNVKREYFKNTKAMAFKLYKDEKFEIDGKEGTIDQLNGRFSFINQIDQYNNYLLYKKSLIQNTLSHQKNLIGQELSKKSESKYYWKYIFQSKDLLKETYYNKTHHTYNLPVEFYDIAKNEKKLYMSYFNAHEKEYKKFLFYRYFFGNDKPIIVTEGKTDPRYLKAALKNLYLNYPELIEKVEGKFLFKIDFLSHSDTIEYLFNVPEGGEGLKWWYNYFSDKNYQNKMSEEEKLLYPNYISYFRKRTGRDPRKATIFLFDNEPKGSPLFNFANYAKDLQIDSNNLEQVRRDNFYKISKKESLYLVAPPLLTNMNFGNSSDIEDLLLSRQKMPTLYMDKQMKTFNKNGGLKHYGKEILSKYVLKHHQKFDFTEFVPLLNAIRDNILDYNV